MELAPNRVTHVIVEVAKALGGSFKLVTLAPRTVREMTQLPEETQKNGDTNKSKSTWKPWRLSKDTIKNLNGTR